MEKLLFLPAADFWQCRPSETPDNKYGGISKQGVEKTDKVY